MCRVYPSIFFAGALLIASLGQASDLAKFDLTDEQISAIKQLRHNAYDQLESSGRSKFRTPGAAITFWSKSGRLALVSISRVEGKGNPGPTIQLTLHIDQLLRGAFDSPEIRTKSNWTPSQEANVFVFSRRPTALDTTEPKVGNRYLIAFEVSEENKGMFFVSGASSLQDPEYAQLFADIQRFLAVETNVAEVNFRPYIESLNDPVAWIRNIAAYRLLAFDQCKVEGECINSILEVIEKMLAMSNPNYRQEALNWTSRIVAESSVRGLTIFSAPIEARITNLLSRTVSDKNISLGDEAYATLERYMFYLSSDPGDCIMILPELRRTIKIPTERTINSPIGVEQICIPKPPAKE